MFHLPCHSCYKTLVSWICFPQCTRGACVETVYTSMFEWGNPLCTTDSVRHAVSKTGKFFCECHKITQTYSQGHTATEILCMYFWDNSCKRRGESVPLRIWWMWDLYLSCNLNVFPKVYYCHKPHTLKEFLPFQTALSDASVKASLRGNKVFFDDNTVVWQKSGVAFTSRVTRLKNQYVVFIVISFGNVAWSNC